MKELDEIQREVAKENGAENFSDLIQTHIEKGEYETARRLMILVTDRYMMQLAEPFKVCSHPSRSIWTYNGEKYCEKCDQWLE